MENTIKSLRVSARVVKINDKQFCTFGTKINGQWFNIKFRKECLTCPKSAGVYSVVVDLNKCSLQKGVGYLDKQGKPRVSPTTIWIEQCVSVSKYSDEDMQKENLEKFDKIFGGNMQKVPEGEDLPF